MTTYKIIAAVLAIATGLAAGCASGEQNPQTGEPTAAAPTTAPEETPTQSPAETGDAVETIRVSVRDGEASPPPDRVSVDQGQRVRVVVTSDQADEVHIHGYDESIELEPGERGSVEFTADQPGVYEVETHGSGTLLFQLVVRG